MERVAFLLENGERLGCLLNPDSLVMRRVAGIRPRGGGAGASLNGAALADDALLYTGGGLTELRLDLLFDVGVAGSSIIGDDVRVLTGPLWRMSENAGRGQASGQTRPRPPLVTFVWGKAWNVSGVVAAIAEKLEYFTQGGAPRRSWVRMRMLRVADPNAAPAAQSPVLPAGLDADPDLEGFPPVGPPEPPEMGDYPTHQVVGGDDERGEGVGERLDQIANQHYGDPSYWRLLAAFNQILDPMHLPAGSVIQVPPLPVLTG